MYSHKSQPILSQRGRQKRQKPTRTLRQTSVRKAHRPALSLSQARLLQCSKDWKTQGQKTSTIAERNNSWTTAVKAKDIPSSPKLLDKALKEVVIESAARTAVEHFKSKASPSTVIGLITGHAVCRIIHASSSRVSQFLYFAKKKKINK